MTTLTKPCPENENLAAKLGPDILRKWLRDMLLIREFEVRTMQAYQNRKIGGFCHVYIGQEAVAVGCVAALRDEDPIITAYRDHGHALARFQRGAARLLRQSDMNGGKLAEEIESLVRDIPALQAMARRSWESRKVHATEQMVSECLTLVHR